MSSEKRKVCIVIYLALVFFLEIKIAKHKQPVTGLYTVLLSNYYNLHWKLKLFVGIKTTNSKKKILPIFRKVFVLFYNYYDEMFIYFSQDNFVINLLFMTYELCETAILVPCFDRSSCHFTITGHCPFFLLIKPIRYCGLFVF